MKKKPRSIWVEDYLKSRNSRITRDFEFNEEVLFKNLTRMSKSELLYTFGDCGANDYKTEYSFQRISAC